MTPETLDATASAVAAAGSRRAAVRAFVMALVALLLPGSDVPANARDAGGRKRDRKRGTGSDRKRNRKQKGGSKGKGCKDNHSEQQILDFIGKAAKKYKQSNSAMVRVARCESGLDPCAFSKAGPYYGLYQFLKSTWKTTPYKGHDIYDPKAQALAAAWMWKQGRKNEWACK